MEEAVHIALQGIHGELQQMREAFEQMRGDLTEHVNDDRAVWTMVYRWDGAIKFLKWSLGVGIPAILTALVALLVRHW
jgi:hypothetical protein